VQCGEEVNFVYSVAKSELRKVECSDFWIKAVTEHMSGTKRMEWNGTMIKKK
jgi:hypothetical protein